MKKFFIVIFAVVVIVVVVIVINTVNGQKKIDQTNAINALQSCFDSDHNFYKSQVDLFYSQAADVYISNQAGTSLLATLTNQLKGEEDCYSQHPLVASNDNFSIQQSCVTNVASYYKQFSDRLTQIAAGVPSLAGNDGEISAQIMGLSQQAQVDCSNGYKT